MLRKVMVAVKTSPAKNALADGLTVTLKPGCGAIDLSRPGRRSGQSTWLGRNAAGSRRTGRASKARTP